MGSAGCNLDVWIIRAISQLASDNRNVASDVQDDIFRYFGSSLMGIQPVDATPAIGNTTWTLTDYLGHTIPAGTTVGITDLQATFKLSRWSAMLWCPTVLT